MIMSSTLTPEEHRRVWEHVCNYADETHQSTPTHPIGAEAVPDMEPLWNYSTEAGCLQWDRFQTSVIAGLQKAAIKPIDPKAWDTHTPSVAKCSPVLIHLKDPTSYPAQTQYPLP